MLSRPFVPGIVATWVATAAIATLGAQEPESTGALVKLPAAKGSTFRYEIKESSKTVWSSDTGLHHCRGVGSPCENLAMTSRVAEVTPSEVAVVSATGEDAAETRKARSEAGSTTAATRSRISRVDGLALAISVEIEIRSNPEWFRPGEAPVTTIKRDITRMNEGPASRPR